LAADESRADSDLLELVNLRLKEGMATQREQAQTEARLAASNVRIGVPAAAQEAAQNNPLSGTFLPPPSCFVLPPPGLKETLVLSK